MEILRTFSFALPSRIEYGTGCISRLPDEISFLKSQKPLIVTDKGISASGLLETVTKFLDDAGVKYDIFDGTAANPRDENVHAGADMARKLGTDCLIAIGGGSSIDCAKGISVMATHSGVIQDYRGVEKIPGATLPVITVPTTAGSGSEVTFSAVITDSAKKTKFSLRSTKIAAKVAICDPNLTVSMPRSITASTGMDALTHAIEGYTANCSEPISSAAALYSIELVSKYLRRAVNDGTDIEARAGMLMASLLGAISFSHSDVAAVHCIAESLGGMYDKPHGVCNAVCLPEVMDYSKEYCIEKYSRAAKAMGLTFSTEAEGAAALVAAVRKMSEDVGIPPFSTFNIPRSAYREIAQKSFENLSNASNPRPLSVDDYVVILERLSGEA
ncbi:MAG: iron-containing alcohol dehydrogenase [Synergistaceae bacterium]|nr:iron-containing alcohol dehydrogenase [Synergistaceae bacterium]